MPPSFPRRRPSCSYAAAQWGKAWFSGLQSPCRVLDGPMQSSQEHQNLVEIPLTLLVVEGLEC